MAQNVTIAGASYSDVPSINVPKTGGGTAVFADPSVVTAVAADVASGKFFIDSTGALAEGTNSGGGGSSYTLLHSEDIFVSTTSTTATIVKTLSNITNAWTSDAIIYVRIRDKAGPRNGYFYGSDSFAINHIAKNGATSPNYQNVVQYVWRYNNSAYAANASSGTSPYGVCASQISSGASSGGIINANIEITKRYSSSKSLTINGTYSVEVYSIAPPANKPFFE